MIRRLPLAALASPAAFAALSLLFAIPASSFATDVSGGIYVDTTWDLAKSPYVATGDIVVFPDATLTIEPGVEVRFAADTGLEVRGMLEAEGTTPTGRIVFTSLDGARWDGIEVMESARVRFRSADFMHATAAISDTVRGDFLEDTRLYDCTFRDNLNGVTGSGVYARMENCLFENNGSGVSASSWRVRRCVFRNNGSGSNGSSKLYFCVFDGNQTGITYGNLIYGCTIFGNGVGVSKPNVLQESVITGNAIGVELSTQYVLVERNNINGNTQHDLTVSLPFTYSLPNNWWGTTDPCLIQDKILDGYDNIQLGLARFSPILDGPIETNPNSIPVGDCFFTVASIPQPCAEGLKSVLLESSILSYVDSAYDAGLNQTIFNYRLAPQEGAAPASLTIGLPEATLAAALPEPYEVVTDPETGVAGVRWTDPAALASEIFTIAVEGDASAGTVECSASSASGFTVSPIAGPRIGCGGETPPEGGLRVMAMGENFAAGGDMNGEWTGGALDLGAGPASAHAKSASISVDAGGLCMNVPAAGDNLAVWVGPDSLIPLVDGAVYRIRVDATTDQTAPDAIPLWDIGFDNYQAATGAGPNFGADAWFLDAAGGANGVGRAQGRSTFEVFFAPNAALAPQWRGTLAEGGGAFTPEADPFNDIRLFFRVLDIGSAGINADLDSGAVCVGSVRIDAFAIADLQTIATLYDAPISNATHAASAVGQSPLFAQIDDASHVASYRLRTGNDRATLFPAVDSDPPNGVFGRADLYPVVWETGALYRVTALIQAAEGAGADPLDAIFINADTATSELGQVSFASRGAPGYMHRAASPRPASAAGGAQPYIAFFAGQNASLAAEPDSARLRPLVDLFNTPDLNGSGSGADEIQVTALKVEKIAAP